MKRRAFMKSMGTEVFTEYFTRHPVPEDLQFDKKRRTEWSAVTRRQTH